MAAQNYYIFFSLIILKFYSQYVSYEMWGSPKTVTEELLV